MYRNNGIDTLDRSGSRACKSEKGGVRTDQPHIDEEAGQIREIQIDNTNTRRAVVYEIARFLNARCAERLHIHCGQFSCEQVGEQFLLDDNEDYLTVFVLIQ